MTTQLTNADEIELAGFYNDALKQDWNDPDEHLEIGRWTKYGHDRLYINEGISKCSKYSLYVDLESHEIVSDNNSKHSGGSIEIEGDTATITIEMSGGKYTHEITVALEGKGFESVEDDEPVVDGLELGPEPADEQTETEEWESQGEVEVLRDGRGRFVSWTVVEDEESSAPTCGCGTEQTWEDDEWVCPRCDRSPKQTHAGASARTENIETRSTLGAMLR